MASHTDEVEVEGYLLNVNVQGEKEGSNQKPRMEFMIQGATEAKRVLYFSVPSEKRKAIEELNKSPVKLSKLRKSNKTEDLIMDNKSIIEDDVALNYKQINMEELTIKNAKQCAIETNVTITGKVKSKSTLTKKGDKEYQHLAVSDQTDTIKVMLWKDLVNKCDEKKTYRFENLKVKRDKSYGDLFLGTAWNNSTKIIEVQDMENVSAATITTPVKDNMMEGEIMTVSRVTRFIQCGFCNNKPVLTDGMYVCNSCKESMKYSFCRKKVVVNLMFVEDGTGARHKVSIFSDVLDDFLGEQAYEVDDTKIKKILLMDGKVKVTLSKKDVITSIVHVKTEEIMV